MNPEFTISESFIREICNGVQTLDAMKLEDFGKSKTALIVIDVINGFIREGNMASGKIESIIKPVSLLMKACNENNIPVLAFADCHDKDCIEFSYFPEHCLDGTSESMLVDEIKDFKYMLIKKNSTNGFHEDKFREWLSLNPQIESFIAVGDCTDICVLQFCLSLRTWLNCADKKGSVTVPLDCVETYDAPFHSADFMNLAAYKIMSDSGVRFVKNITV